MVNIENTVNQIVAWLGEYARGARMAGFVVGVSGGVDSAVVSTLAAMTGLPTLVVSLPIHQPADHLCRAQEHIAQLKARFGNVCDAETDLTKTFEAMREAISEAQSGTIFNAFAQQESSEQARLTDANTRSRLRMAALYYFAGLNNYLVVGTGNKIEDFGVGFFTKYGDGGVDISPIGDLTKTEVYALAEYLAVPISIREAAPSDGLFTDARSDEEQIGASYPELEWAMERYEQGATETDFEGRQREVFRIFCTRHRANRHKIEPIPVCKIDGRSPIY